MTNEIETTWASKFLFFLLCATIIFTTLAYGTVHQPVIAIFYLIAAIIILLWAFDAFATGALRFNKSLVQIPLLLAFLYGIFQIIPFGSVSEVAGLNEISRTISQNPFWTQIASLHFIALFIFLAALLTYIDSAKRLNKIILVITIFGFVFAFFAILQSVLSPNKIYGIYEVAHATPFGSFVNRHNFAAFMEMCIAVPLGLMFVGAVQKDKKLLYVTAIALMGIAIILSGSRGGLVALLAEIFFLIFLTTKTKGYNQLILKVGLGILLVATIIVGSTLIGGESSLTRIAETVGTEDVSSNRTHIWNVTLSIIKNNFIFGTGYGSFGVAYTPYDTLNGLERVEQAHNDYLQVLSDAGIIGLIIAGLFVFTLFQSGIKNAQSSIPFRRGVAVGALAGCFAILVHSIFDFVLHTTAIAMMFITLTALVIVSRNKFPEDVPEVSPKRSKKRRTENVIPIGKRRENLSADDESKAE